MKTTNSPLHYGDYLKLDTLLSLQETESGKRGRPAHDEMLFIVTHQTYELWFKQMIFEFDSILELFARTWIDERQIGIAVSRLERIAEIEKLLIEQLRVLETMTPLDFLDFRNFLTP